MEREPQLRKYGLKPTTRLSLSRFNANGNETLGLVILDTVANPEQHSIDLKARLVLFDANGESKEQYEQRLNDFNQLLKLALKHGQDNALIIPEMRFIETLVRLERKEVTLERIDKLLEQDKQQEERENSLKSMLMDILTPSKSKCATCTKIQCHRHPAHNPTPKTSDLIYRV